STIPSRIGSIHSLGLVVAQVFIFPTARDNKWYLPLLDVFRDIRSAFEFAQEFYSSQSVEVPGLLQVSVGLNDVAGVQTAHDGDTYKPFRDSTIRLNRVVDYNEFANPFESSTGPNMHKSLAPILSELLYVCDITT